MPGLMDILQGVLSAQKQPTNSLAGILSMPPAVAPNDAATQAYQQYPLLKNLGVKFLNSSGYQSQHGGGSETYHGNELYNPLPGGRPTIEQFDPNMTAQGFLGEALHLLPESDQFVGNLKNAFINSMTPQQQQKMREQYEYARQNFGENRTFDKWKEISGDDSWFRGHVTGQWPASAYTPEQLQMFRALIGHLRGGK